MICMQPIWGAATLGTVVLWPLATVIQFGVGRYVGPLCEAYSR
jgi:hypothetical protein